MQFITNLGTENEIALELEDPKSDLPKLKESLENAGVEKDLISAFLGDLAEAPPIPRPKNINDIPPARSEIKPLGSAPLREFLEGSEKFKAFFKIEEERKGKFKPPFPPEGSTARLVVFWKNIASRILFGPQTFSQGFSITRGTSKTTTKSVTAQAGFSAKGLSAQVSATFSTSFTISEEETESKTFSVNVPEGKVFVFWIWQLVKELEFMDAKGNLLDYRGRFDFIVTLPIRLKDVVLPVNTNNFAAVPTSFDQQG